MNGEYQLVPHLHFVPASSCQDTAAKKSTSLTSASYDGGLALQHAIPVCCNVPIGRMHLISAAVNACGSRNDCPFCSQITLAARFLSKEMMAFTSDSNEAKKDSIKLIIQKCGKLIRINQKKVQEEEPIDVPSGSIISVFLPHDPARGSMHDQSPRKESRLSIQFTFISKKKESMRTREETRRPGCAPTMHKKTASEPQEQSQDNSQEGESPTLIMPHYLSFEAHGQNNSFESSISGGLLTLQESTSNLSSQKVSSNAPDACGCLLSSLSKEQLTKLLNTCDDSNAGKFRKSMLEIALGDDPLPPLLRSTRINVNGDLIAD